MENPIQLSKAQLEQAIYQYIERTQGVNELFSMFVNGLMYAERSAFLSDGSSEGNKGNGYRQVVKKGISSGLRLQVPRDRLGEFKPLILGILDQQEELIKDLSFVLYGKGLTTRQIGDVLNQIYGDHYSKSTVSRITEEFSEQVKAWLNRPLAEYYPVIFIDAVHCKVRRDQVQTEAFYIVLGLREDFTREVLSIINFPTESANGWQEVLEKLRQRGLQQVTLFVSDDLQNLDESISLVFPQSLQQKCTLHLQRNLTKRIRPVDREGFCQEMKNIFASDKADYTPEQGEEKLKQFLLKWAEKYPALKNTANRYDLGLYFTYLSFDVRVRKMIYTTNWIERLNKAFKRTLKVRNALPSVEAVITLLGYTAMEMQDKTYKYPVSNFKFEPKFNPD